MHSMYPVLGVAYMTVFPSITTTVVPELAIANIAAMCLLCFSVSLKQ